MPGKANANAKEKKNKKGLPKKKTNGNRSKSSIRPTTRRNPDDSPVKAKSLERTDMKEFSDKRHASISIAAKRDSLTTVQTESVQHILQFSLRITEDIIKNDMYSNQDMMAVLRAHYQDNKGALDEDKMLVAIAELCKELNIPFDIRGFEDNMCYFQTSQRTPETLAERHCICPAPTEVVYSELCECGVPRPPPIACPLHEDDDYEETRRKQREEEERRKEEERLRMEEEERLRMEEEERRRMEEERLREEAEKFDDQSKTDTDQMGSLTDPTADSLDTNKDPTDIYPILMNLMDQNNEKPKKKKRCMCGSESCDPSNCDVSIDDSEILFLIEDDEEGIDEEIDEPEIFPDEEEPEPIKIPEVVERESIKTKDQTCICNNEQFAKDKLMTYLDYFEQHMGHSRHVRALDFCHHLTTIEPMKIETHDLSVQTSTDHIYKPTKLGCCCDHHQVSTNYQKLQFPKEVPCRTQLKTQSRQTATEQQPDCMHQSPMQFELPKAPSDDFVVISGPIFIPKDLAKSGRGIAALFQAPVCSPNTCPSNNFSPTTRQVTPKSCTRSTTYQYSTQNLDCVSSSPRQEMCPKKQEMFPRKLDFCHPNLFHSNEYDLTPQRDTFHSEDKRNNCCCDFQRDNATLLLGNTYNKLMMPRDECNLSLYYPTIATQVSSMDLLNYVTLNGGKKPIDIDKKRPLLIDGAKPMRRITLNDSIDEEETDGGIMDKLDEVVEPQKEVVVEEEATEKTSSNESDGDIQDDEDSEPLVRDRAVSVSINADVDIIADTDNKKQTGYSNRIQMRK